MAIKALRNYPNNLSFGPPDRKLIDELMRASLPIDPDAWKRKVQNRLWEIVHDLDSNCCCPSCREVKAICARYR